MKRHPKVRHGTPAFKALASRGWVIEREALITILRLRSLQLGDEMMFVRPEDNDNTRITSDQLTCESQLKTVYERYSDDLNGAGWAAVGWRRPLKRRKA